MSSSSSANEGVSIGPLDWQTLLLSSSSSSSNNNKPNGPNGPSSSSFHPFQPPPPNPNNNSGARLMALLKPTPQQSPFIKPTTTKAHTSSSDVIIYDVDDDDTSRRRGPRQLEVTPITKYTTEPALVLGRQIAVNERYICYGLRQGNIRVLNMKAACRALLKGHSQRVTDMAFFREEVHLLASVSVDGTVYVWKINEGPDKDDTPQITEQIIIAIQIEDEGESKHPRVCWHSHKQEYLVVGIGKHVLKIDTTKVGKNGIFSGEKPVKCHVNNLIDGVQFVGKHDGEVTDLSMCQWMTTRLVSASTDGTVKIWDDKKELPLVVLRPHDGQPVNAAIFLTANDRPNHINLVTAGPLNREVKIWASASEEGWLLASDAESWQCTQILNLKSSVEPQAENAFFNQILAMSQAGLVLLANAKRNAIYAVHIEYGQNPVATRMDYITEFAVRMPILSLTGTNDCLPDGEHVVQVYCVQTQAIQQYALHLSLCLPPTPKNMDLEKSNSAGVYWDSAAPLRFNASSDTHMLISRSEGTLLPRYPSSSGISEVSNESELPYSYLESKQTLLTEATTDSNNVWAASPFPLSPMISGFASPSESLKLGLPPNDVVDQPSFDCSVDRKLDTVPSNLRSIPSLDDSIRKDENEVIQNDVSVVSNPHIMFRHPTHLVTPAEIFSMAVSSSENTQVSQGMRGESKVVVSNDAECVAVKGKVVVETGSVDEAEIDSRRGHQEAKVFWSQASSLNFGMPSEYSAPSTEDFLEIQQADGMEPLDPSKSSTEEEIQDSTEYMPQKVPESANETIIPQPTLLASKEYKHKGKFSLVAVPNSPSPIPFNSTDSSSEPVSNSHVASLEAAIPKILAIQETVSELMTMQKEMQKQMTTVITDSVTKENKRLEASLNRGLERAIRANNEALWARFHEENTKSKKLEQEYIQQIGNFISNYVNKDLMAMLERTLKKELAAIGQTVSRLVMPAVEKSVFSTITESFQKGVGEEAVTQLEKSIISKLEGTLARQIQTQFQTSGKQALQDALRSSMEAFVIPAFEMSCKAMFEQVDVVFQKGLVEYTAAVQQQFDATHSPITHALRDAIGSVSSVAQTLTKELADGQHNLLALAAAGANSKTVNPLVSQSMGGIHDIATPTQHVEAPLDPTKQLTRLISERKFEEAFTKALQRSDVFLVSWLCSQVDLQKILRIAPLPLSQGVLLALLQQLACDINNNTSQKLTWMREVVVAISPSDPMISVHVRPFFEQVYQLLGQYCSLLPISAAETSSIRLVMHVINSMLMSCT